MGSKKRKFRFPWTFFWGLAFLAVTGAGLWLSDITRIQIVRVDAKELADQPRIERILEKIEGKPALRVRPHEIESFVDRNPQVRMSTFYRNAFGRARLKVDYRQPVATYGASQEVDEDGEIFASLPGTPPNLAIQANVQVMTAYLTICDPSPLRIAARLAKKLQVLVPELAGNIAFDARGGISFNSGDLLVEFGDGGRLQDKVDLLRKALDQHPELLEHKARLNLVDPDNPMQGE
jgi:hypothetical protein